MHAIPTSPAGIQDGTEAQLMLKLGHIAQPITTGKSGPGRKVGKHKYNTVDRPCGCTRSKKRSCVMTGSFNPFMNFIWWLFCGNYESNLTQ